MIEPQLYSPHQLPDLDDQEMRFEWEQDEVESIVRYGEVIVWRERTGWGVFERFAEIADVLSFKYGEKLQDLAPTPGSRWSLLGDSSAAAAHVAAARATFGREREVKWYDLYHLAHAIKGGDRETIRHFLAQGGDPSTGEYGTGLTLLHVAAERRQTAIVRMLLCAGAATDIVDTNGQSPLCKALDEPPRAGGGVVAGNFQMPGPNPYPAPRQAATLEVIRLLLDAGASLDGVGAARQHLQGWGVRMYKPPLAWAAKHGNLTALRLLLERGAHPNQANLSGMTALQYAVKAGGVEAARMLCEAGADPNASYHPPLWTPLHSVIWSSDAKQNAAALIRLLVHYGADINKGESNGNTPLFAAISEAHHDLVRLLLELGADIEHRNLAGAGAAVFLVQRMRMRMLSEEEMLPIVQTLLAAGLDPTAQAPGGQTAGDLARDHGYSAIAALLKAA
jgi:uncharacterized protein